MYCKYCGTLANSDAVFCDRCGRNLREPAKPMGPRQINVMFIEDLFAIKDKGYVITGIVQCDSVSVGDIVCINGQRYQVLGLESYQKLIQTATKGMGIGMLIQGVGGRDYRIGDMVYKQI